MRLIKKDFTDAGKYENEWPGKIGKTTSYRWVICALLFLATTVNYLDRQVLSLLEPLLAEKYRWTNSDYANITSFFQFGYAIAMLFAGRLVDRLGTKKGYKWSIIIWSIGAMLHAFAVPIGSGLSNILAQLGILSLSMSVAGFMFCRLVLAVGEAGNFPCAIKATAEYFPKQERAFATGIFNSGSNIGAILAPLTVPFIEVNWGWQAAFIIIGAIGLLWLVAWSILYDKPENQKRLSEAELQYICDTDEIQFKKTLPLNNSVLSERTERRHSGQRFRWVSLLRLKQTWAFVAGKFLTDGVWWFFLFWLPAYLKAQFFLEKTSIMLPLAVLYSLTMLGSVAGGWFPSLYIKKGLPVYNARLKAMLVIATIPLVVLLAQPLGYISYWVPVILIGVAASAHQAWSANIFTTVSDLFPKQMIASVVGLGGMAGGIGGVIVSKVGGAVFDHFTLEGHIETGYTLMFSYCAVAYLLAWLLIKLLVPTYKAAVAVV